MTLAKLAKITEGLRESVGDDCGLDATIKFDFGEDGIVCIDATQTPNVVSNDDNEAQCTLKLSMSNFVELSKGRLNSVNAVMTGRLKIVGDMSLAKRLNKIF
jgi:putative sterol carrier protein|tara:strand:+ start:428 stop:733 length:306 start_codon:yes stop_codon:yes gene_type:complete